MAKRQLTIAETQEERDPDLDEAVEAWIAADDEVKSLTQSLKAAQERREYARAIVRERQMGKKRARYELPGDGEDVIAVLNLPEPTVDIKRERHADDR